MLARIAIATTRETRASYLPRLPPGQHYEQEEMEEQEEDEEDCELDRLQAQADALLRKRAKPVVFRQLSAAAGTWSAAVAGAGAASGAANNNNDGTLGNMHAEPRAQLRPRPRPLTILDIGPGDGDGSMAGADAPRASPAVRFDDQQLDSDQRTAEKGGPEEKNGRPINDRNQAADAADNSDDDADEDADSDSIKPNTAVAAAAATVRAKLERAGAALLAGRSLDALRLALHALSLAKAGDKAEDKQWCLPQQQGQGWTQEQQEQQRDALAAACYFWKGAGEARLGLHDDALDSFRRAGTCRGRHIEGEWLDGEIDAAIDALSEARLVSTGF